MSKYFFAFPSKKYNLYPPSTVSTYTSTAFAPFSVVAKKFPLIAPLKYKVLPKFACTNASLNALPTTGLVTNTGTNTSFTAAFTSRVNSFVSVTSPHVKVAVNFTSVSSSGQVIANLPLLTTAHGLSEAQVIVTSL